MNPKTGVVSRRMMSRWNALVFVAIGSLIAAGVPIRGTETAGDEQEQWQRFSERCASISLKTLTVAEEDFRTNDRDWNHVNDFWTSNMSQLYSMTSAQVQGQESTDAIRLIELSIQSANDDH